MTNNKIARQGYCILTMCLSGPELVWRELNQEGDYPEIHDTERDAQVAIVDNQIEHMQEFLTHDREYNDIDWQHDYEVAKIIVYEDGELMIYHGDDNCPQPILETTLSEWQNNL